MLWGILGGIVGEVDIRGEEVGTAKKVERSGLEVWWSVGMSLKGGGTRMGRGKGGCSFFDTFSKNSVKESEWRNKR